MSGCSTLGVHKAAGQARNFHCSVFSFEKLGLTVFYCKVLKIN